MLLRTVIAVLSATIWWTLAISCTKTKPYTDSAGHAVIDCGKQDLTAIAALAADLGARAALAGHVDWDAIETAAKGAGLGVGSCALAEFLRAIRKQPLPQVAAMTGGPVPDLVALGQAALARVSGGASVKLADGTTL